MDTGLTDAQETFVEAWSSERVLEVSRTMRQLMLILQHWTRTHRDDTDLDEALTILAALPDAGSPASGRWGSRRG